MLMYFIHEKNTKIAIKKFRFNLHVHTKRAALFKNANSKLSIIFENFILRKMLYLSKASLEQKKNKLTHKNHKISTMSSKKMFITLMNHSIDSFLNSFSLTMTIF